MKKIYFLKVLTFVIVLSLPFVFSCSNKRASVPQSTNIILRDLTQIQDSGKMVVVTDFNSINYFIYRGQPLGFQYDLLQELSDHLDLKIEVKVNNDLQKNFDDLLSGEVDIIASNLTITKERRKMVDFILPHDQTRQVLVQRKEKTSNPYEKSVEEITNPLELAGKTVYVQKNSSHAKRLYNLSEEIGEKINIVEVPIETEQLIRMVARKEIDYTIADENIAKLNNAYFKDLNIETAVSFPQNQAWAVRKESVELKNAIDTWFSEFKQSRKYAILHYKYFRSNRQASVVKSDFYYTETGRISRYDEILKVESEKIGWDWRLLASMIYQESRFNPDAVSWAGAFGIMQLMPFTAKQYGVSIESSPVSHIRAGIRFIHWLDLKLQNYVEDKDERVKFILASYNIGIGHILDAIKLAEKHGKNPQIWENNVEYFLLKKSEPEYYTDPVVRHGYAKGTETYRYVREIMHRYNHYLNYNQSNEIAQILP